MKNLNQIVLIMNGIARQHAVFGPPRQKWTEESRHTIFHSLQTITIAATATAITELNSLNTPGDPTFHQRSTLEVENQQFADLITKIITANTEARF